MAYSNPALAPGSPRQFAARLRRLVVAGTIVAVGAIWALVAGDVVGVTSRAASGAARPAPAISGNSPYYGGSSAGNGAAGNGAAGNGAYYGSGAAGNGGFFGSAPNPGLGAAGNQAPLLGSGGS